MKRNLFNKNLLLIIVTVLAFVLSGCGSSFELTNEESKLVAEYAAGLLLKYSSNYSESLVKYYDQPDDELVQKIKDAEQKKEEAIIAEEASEFPTEDSENSDKSTEKKRDTIYTTKNIAESIGLDGFSINYTDYKIVDSYPENASDMTFSLDAADGKHLLVLCFDLVGDGECDILTKNPTFRIVVNGQKRINEQQTILMDDLKQFMGNVSSAEKTVLIFEVDDETASNIEQIDLYVKANGEQSVHKIK